MADEESTIAPATPVADTSTNEDPEVSLEEVEVNLDDTEEEPEPEAPEPETPDTEPETPTEEPAEDVEESPDEPQSEEEKRKATNKEMAERRIQEKQQRAATLKEQQAEYLAEADPERPEDAALRQLQIDAYDNKVEANSNKLTNQYEKAVNDFPILAETTPEIKAEVDAAIDAFQAMHVSLDAYGNPTEVRGDLYHYLQTKADSIEKLTGIRKANQKVSKDKEKSKTLATPTRAPKEPKTDPDLAAFDEEAKR